MDTPDTAAPPSQSLLRDWRDALRYWLRGRNGVIAALVLAVVVGAALNWSWLVAAGVAPLLITVLPCAAMCALGLCMNRMAGRGCATATRPVETPEADARIARSAEAEALTQRPLLTDAAIPLDEPAPGAGTSASDPAHIEERN